MSFDVFTMPAAAPPPGTNGARCAPGKEPAAGKLDRPAHSADQKKSFLATLNRVSERKTCRQPRSRARERQTATPANDRRIVDQDAVQDPTARSEVSESVPETPFAGERPVMEQIYAVLLNMLAADGGAPVVEGQPDSNSNSTNTVLNQLMGHFQPEGQNPLDGRVGIGPFEQLQTDISAEAGRLAFLRQLLSPAIVHQLAAGPSGSEADNPFSQFWRSLTATATEGGDLGGRPEGFAAKVDALINFLLQRYENTSPAAGLEAMTVEANGKQTAVNGQALNATENLLHPKMTGAVQSAEAQPAETTQTSDTEKDGRLSAGAAKQLNAETLLEPRVHKSGENSQAARPQPVPKAAEPAVNPNLATAGIPAKPSENAVSLNSSGLQTDILPADQTGSKVIQIDGEAKDSNFLASQENLPEHLAKLEHTGRSAEGAQRGLASQTLNQIVQKAVLLNNNGQNMVQIDLKPDFLGHIRMQIVTESQQVAIRIVAELPFVKDMLESNLNQLKAELQAQGLKVDELEVSVAHDSRADDDLHQKAAEARRARAMKNSRFSADQASEKQVDRRTGSGRGLTETAIDYFA